MRGGLQERHCGRQAAGASEALEAEATVRETSPACLRSQPCAQEPQSPERETAKPGRGSDDGPNTVGDDARYCGGRPRFPERAPPLTTSFPGRVRRRPRMCCAPPPLPPTRDFFFFFFLPLLAMLAGGVPRSSVPRGRSLFPGSLRPARAPESRPCSPLRRSRARLRAPPGAAAPGARAAGRERCLGRHLREREPGRANRGRSGPARRSPPCGTRRKRSREGDLCFPGMGIHTGVGSTFQGNAWIVRKVLDPPSELTAGI